MSTSNDKEPNGKKPLAPPRKGYRLIWRAYITTKSGKRLYARQFGKKAFPI